MAEKVEVENVNVPGQVSNVDAAKYHAMRDAMQRVTPYDGVGLTAKQIKEAAIPHLPEALFPGGQTAGWWQKTVQLDLEAKGVMARSKTSPLRFWFKQKS
ncbi:MAG: hypothetical protein AAGG69_06910 [Pseudomonadota bacterium]